MEVVLSADGAVRSQMEFWNDNDTPVCFSMVIGEREALVTSADCKSVALWHTGFESLVLHQIEQCQLLVNPAKGAGVNLAGQRQLVLSVLTLESTAKVRNATDFIPPR